MLGSGEDGCAGGAGRMAVQYALSNPAYEAVMMKMMMMMQGLYEAVMSKPWEEGVPAGAFPLPTLCNARLRPHVPPLLMAVCVWVGMLPMSNHTLCG